MNGNAQKADVVETLNQLKAMGFNHKDILDAWEAVPRKTTNDCLEWSLSFNIVLGLGAWGLVD